jgi:hypothetical protein
MEKIIGTYTTKALEWLNTGALWISSETPKYIEELLLWKSAERIIYIVIALLIAALGIVLFTQAMHLKKQGKVLFCDEGFTVRAVLGFIILIITFSFLGYNTYHLVYIKAAPRVYLVEYLSSLIKN